MLKLTPMARAVYTHLQQHPHLTRVQAQAVYRIFDLPGRIQEVRKALAVEGKYEITSTLMKDAQGKRYTRYALKRVAKRKPLPRNRSLVVAGPRVSLDPHPVLGITY